MVLCGSLKQCYFAVAYYSYCYINTKSNMNLTDIKTGDTILVTDYNNWLSKTICKVMTKYGKQKGYKTDTILSHACTAVWIGNELYVFGSIESGYKPWLFRKHYSLTDINENGIVLMRRKHPLSASDESALTHYCMHLNTVSIAYQYWNFFQWLAKVYLKINLFKQDSDNFNYCYESAYMCRKVLNPYSYGDTYMTSFFDLYFDPNYEVIYRNVKTLSKD